MKCFWACDSTSLPFFRYLRFNYHLDVSWMIVPQRNFPLLSRLHQDSFVMLPRLSVLFHFSYHSVINCLIAIFLSVFSFGIKSISRRSFFIYLFLYSYYLALCLYIIGTQNICWTSEKWVNFIVSWFIVENFELYN